jgi:hypothetical protein
MYVNATAFIYWKLIKRPAYSASVLDATHPGMLKCSPHSYSFRILRKKERPAFKASVLEYTGSRIALKTSSLNSFRTGSNAVTNA